MGCLGAQPGFDLGGLPTRPALCQVRGPSPQLHGGRRQPARCPLTLLACVAAARQTSHLPAALGAPGELGGGHLSREAAPLCKPWSPLGAPAVLDPWPLTAGASSRPQLPAHWCPQPWKGSFPGRAPAQGLGDRRSAQGPLGPIYAFVLSMLVPGPPAGHMTVVWTPALPLRRAI